MLSLGLKLEGYAIDAVDGALGTVADAVFDDKTCSRRVIPRNRG
jgi:hypothetical protein